MRFLMLCLSLAATLYVVSLFVDKDNNVENLAHNNWSKFDVLEALIDAEKACADNPKILNCQFIPSWLEDVRRSFVSCKADPSSSLCRSLLVAAEDKKYKALFGDVDGLQPMELLHSPVELAFGKLPTRLLRDNASDYSYTKEMLLQFYERWRMLILVLGFGGILIVTIYLWNLLDQKPEQEVKDILLPKPLVNQPPDPFPHNRWFVELEGEEAEEQFAKERQEQEERKAKWTAKKQKVITLTEAEKAAFEQIKANIRSAITLT